ncbi:MAG: hypothetical protein FRX48_06298 [Lasallia pustulata]|uniref:Uncharacterized protein n=1 Tax=Lasallia pustulata TaxID=136370 RepID=A0A5M8PLR9_9LECA|nr:MAG: hypothetical protein FRX48_06298 [Lasallia pustulata]
MASNNICGVHCHEEGKQPSRGTIVLEETKDHDVPWYTAELGPRYPPQVHHLFKTYVGLPDEEILPHIKDRGPSPAFFSAPSPLSPEVDRRRRLACQSLANPSLPQYWPVHLPQLHLLAPNGPHATILHRLRHENALLLDIGTGFG